MTNIHTPLMFILGEEDYRTPPAAGGEDLFRALKYLKRPDGHGAVSVGEPRALPLGPSLAPRRTPPAHRRLVRQMAAGERERHLRGAVRTPGAPTAAPAATATRDPGPPTRADILRGEYGRYRANNDLLYYHLDVRVDPDKKIISGKNTIRFKMLQDDTRIQIDLYANLKVDKILLGDQELKVRARAERRLHRFSRDTRTGAKYTHRLSLLRHAPPDGPFRRDCVPQGSRRPSLDLHRLRGRRLEHLVAEQGPVARRSREHGHQRRRPQRPGRRLERPLRRQDRPGRRLHALGLARAAIPINSYCVSLNIGNYEHFSRQAGRPDARFLRARRRTSTRPRSQFAQAKPMIEAYQHYFGEYPFTKDGYKLIEVPYTGMEHQSAVTYGNRFRNGYVGRDWTGVGISPKFDFIIIHESGHEWFGNAVSAADVSDMWIHEGWTTYLEGLYVEHMFGHDDALKYVNGYKRKVRQSPADHHAARHSSLAAAGPVLQGRALPQHAAQRHQRRREVVEAACAISYQQVQVPEHHDRGLVALLQRADRLNLHADLRPVPAPRGAADAGTEIRRGRRHGRLSLEGR